ncbi:AAA family ATPase [Flavobacterium ginsenosidimutans]|uniref:AAA family ATPase n=1 Tax=Flavobacterium ginsenosidimutans TaxID=687844 RepID=UPI000DAC7C74|nr:AAA family ATPase [Flavobacterium ginsenosidimutans]KAF2338030.1 AAA family ATPase [Flavobacterium ginsenosidimutans]
MEGIDYRVEVLGRVDLDSNDVISKERNEKIGLFTVKRASKWIEEAKMRPIPKMLFGEFWFEGELCILFADTNLGKSILAVQIGNSISKSKAIPPFNLDAPKQTILYFDFELSTKQFENRYSKEYSEHYDFDNNFIRIEIDSDIEIPDGQDFEGFLCDSLENSITSTNAKIIIIDNITFLRNGNESAKDALPLMKQLKALKSKYGLSILVLGHTPKRDLSKPLTINDIAGSKMLGNFCDSAFAIGQSSFESGLRYLKQLKQRNTEQIYDSENVCVCQISKHENFLEFEFLDYSDERNHLKEFKKSDREELIGEVKALSAIGKTQREIRDVLGISLGAVNKYLNI